MRSKLSRRALALAAALCLIPPLALLTAQPAGATVTTVSASADAFTASDLPNTVENTSYVSQDGSPLRYGYYKFPVTVPAGEAVTSAVFKCWAGSSNSTGMGLWTTSSTWSETTLTWSNAPVPNFGLPASGSTGAVTSGQYNSADVTSAITGSGTYTLVGKTTSTTQWSCASKENSGNHPPQLVVTTTAVDNPPVAALTVTPSSGDFPLAVTADGSASTDADATPISTYTFAWGDGTANTGPQAGTTAPHTYAVAGTFTVTLTVTDTAGKTGTVTQQVTVTAPATHTNTALPARGAFYYPWYPETWGNVNSPDTHYTPTLGFYDSSAVMASHVTSLAYGNFAFAPASWWGQGSLTDGRFGPLLTAAHGSTVKFAPYYEAEGNTISGVTGSPNPTSAQITADLNYLAAHYVQDPNYMWIADKPVIFAFGDGTDSCGMNDRWAAGNAAATTHFYVVLKVFSGYASCTNQPDNWHQYGPATRVDQQGSHSYSLSPGYFKYTDQSPLLARDPAGWSAAINAMNCATADLKLVTTFNEWGEGTAVESASGGNGWASGSGQGTYLDALHDNPTCSTDAAPVAALTVTPASGTVPLAVTADASASTDTDATPIASYTFTFGDGSPAVGPQPGATATHTYTTAGSYTVTVTVTDTGGLTGQATKPVTATSGGGGGGTPVYDHIFYVMFENHDYSAIIGNSNAPYLNSLTNTGGLATNYHAITHPSVNNYLAAVSGQVYSTVPPAVGSAITDGCQPTTTTCSANAANLADGIEAVGKTWKGYMETMPSPCYGPHDSGLYTERHNPFPYFNQIRTNPTRCARYVPYTQLATDLTSAATTPNFAWITPNLCDDMHNSCAPSNSVTNGDTWASNEFPKIFNSPAWTTQHSLLVINEDENSGTAGNQVPAIFVSSDGTVVAGKRSAVNYTHYSLLRTIEDSLGVTPVGPGDQVATAMAMFGP